mmetsp:Transcript_94572/g.253806  ORF Transcript_94572/g.253806 Transcript_94572/m.253806 type:complete len:200 (-) Transcript_94572:674-1273(-)
MRPWPACLAGLLVSIRRLPCDNRNTFLVGGGAHRAQVAVRWRRGRRAEHRGGAGRAAHPPRAPSDARAATVRAVPGAVAAGEWTHALHQDGAFGIRPDRGHGLHLRLHRNRGDHDERTFAGRPGGQHTDPVALREPSGNHAHPVPVDERRLSPAGVRAHCAQVVAAGDILLRPLADRYRVLDEHGDRSHRGQGHCAGRA